MDTEKILLECRAVYYTTDGSMPTEDSDVYESGIEISESTTIRAALFVDGQLIGKVIKQYFEKLTR